MFRLYGVDLESDLRCISLEMHEGLFHYLTVNPDNVVRKAEELMRTCDYGTVPLHTGSSDITFERFVKQQVRKSVTLYMVTNYDEISSSKLYT